jgi:hypothetical protein
LSVSLPEIPLPHLSKANFSHNRDCRSSNGSIYC